MKIRGDGWLVTAPTVPTEPPGGIAGVAVAVVDESVMGGTVGALATVGRSEFGLGCFTSACTDGSGASAGRLDPT